MALFHARIDLSTALPSQGPSLLKSGWIRSLQESLEWSGLLQPSQLPLVTVLVLAVGVAASFFALLAVTVDPLVACPPMRLVSAVSRSHLCMMLATISHSLPRVGFE